MTRPLRLLLIEDSPDDAELLLRELRGAGFDPQSRRVATRQDLERALDVAWDIILCDYRLSGFDAPAVLAIVRERQISTPCIVVSGTVSEEHAVTAMRHGAQDFISKDRLGRLVPAIERELRDSEVRIKQAITESTLRATEASFRGAFELIPDGVLVHRDGHIVHANGAAVMLLGSASVDDLVGRSVLDLFAPSNRELVRMRLDDGDALKERTPLVELSMVRLDGRSVDVETTAMPVLFEGEAAILAVVRDVSARRELVARTMHVDRMLAIGTLAAGVGHEINNPLAYIMANLGYAGEEVARVRQTLEPRRANDPAIASLLNALSEVVLVLGEADDGARRIRDITRDLKTYARADDDEPELVDVCEAADSALRMAAPELRQRARVTRDYGEVPPIVSSRSRVGQVLLNLIVNAAHAIGEGRPEANEISVRIRREGPSVVIDVRDTGCGIAPEHLERLFTPFFTTKPMGKGTGLGLSISRRIVRSLGGDIHVQSDLGRGTTMSVVLPAAPGASTAETPTPAPVARRCRILFVDDDRTVATAFQRALSREHEVVVVDSAGEALKRLGLGEAYDVIFCGLNMPTMTGADLFEVIERTLPKLTSRVVVITGGETDARTRTFVEMRRAPVLEKPLDMRQVRAHLAKVAAGLAAAQEM
jgi:PAS domain S-box-containing protein